MFLSSLFSEISPRGHLDMVAPTDSSMTCSMKEQLSQDPFEKLKSYYYVSGATLSIRPSR